MPLPLIFVLTKDNLLIFNNILITNFTNFDNFAIRSMKIIIFVILIMNCERIIHYKEESQ